MMHKPSYSTTKLHLWITCAAAWLLIFMLIIAAILGSPSASAAAVGLVPIVLPTMVALIVTSLGIHRGFGSLDMHTMANQAEHSGGQT